MANRVSRIAFLTCFLLSCCGFAAQPAPKAGEQLSLHSESAAETATSTTAESIVVKTAAQLIYGGQIDAASELIKQTGTDQQSQPGRLLAIVEQYREITRRREQSREAAYREQLSELEKFRAGSDTNDANDANDVNDVNNLTPVLAVIAKISEFADQQQKDELLSDSFVKGVFQKAVARADEFEAKGKWLDAYITCYSWLQVIDEDNQAYSDYAEQLVAKANIVASFQDSPCETRKERLKGVRKKMFVRAIGALNFNYVSVIDYRQMVTKAIKRCKLLAEVMKFPIDDFRLAIENRKSFSAWSAGLDAILDESNQSPMGISKDEFIDVFENVLALNKTTAELPEEILIVQFAEAALSALDSHTLIIWPRQKEDFEKLMTNEFTGIGIEISKVKGLLTVVSLLLDTPAFNSGLIDAGDIIEKVDDVPTKDMTLMCAVKNITGPAGTKVTLMIRHPSEDKNVEGKILDVTLTRARVTVPTIRGWQRTETGRWLYMIDGVSKIGYVRITGFSKRTASDLEGALSRLEAEGLKGLILDLRFNSGGLLNSAVDVTDKFIEEGLIVSTRPRFGVWTYEAAHKKNTHPNYPLVVLINRFSASASEIVAGALADKAHNRAVLVGERTHGKGSVQGIISYLNGGAQLKYTMAYYHLPSGQKVESQDTMKKRGREDWGIRPNIEVKLRSDELKEKFDVQRDNDVLVKADHDKATAPLKKHMVEETLAADPQLAVGVLIIKTKLIEKANRGSDR
jgi:carboxyl-terminal processing protease